MRKEVRYAFQKTSPVMLGFLFLGAGYGIYMHKTSAEIKILVFKFHLWYDLVKKGDFE